MIKSDSVSPTPVAPATPVPSSLTPYGVAQLSSWCLSPGPLNKPPKEVWEVIGKYYEPLRLSAWLAQFESPNLALASAAENGQLAEARYALAAGADVDACNCYPLRTAAENGHAEVVALLLEAEADADAATFFGPGDRLVGGALLGAVRIGHAKIVKLLLDAEANVMVHYDLMLEWAAEGGHVEIVRLLRVAGGEIENE